MSTGVAVAGNVGSESRCEYTVIGDAVNEAARLTDAAKGKPGLLLASAETVRAARVVTRWVPARGVRLRGRETTTAVYVLG